MEDDNIGLQDANSDNEDSPDQNFEESSIGSDLEMDVNKTQFDKVIWIPISIKTTNLDIYI